MKKKFYNLGTWLECVYAKAELSSLVAEAVLNEMLCLMSQLEHLTTQMMNDYM